MADIKFVSALKSFDESRSKLINKLNTIVPLNKNVSLKQAVNTTCQLIDQNIIPEPGFYVRIIDGYTGEVLYYEENLTNGTVVTLPNAPDHTVDNLEFEYWTANQAIENNSIVVDNNNVICAAYYQWSNTLFTEYDQFYVTVNATTGLTGTVYIRASSAAHPVTIDWGDNSEVTIVSSTFLQAYTHTYTNYGEYIIQLYDQEGVTYSAGGSSSNNIFGNTSNNWAQYACTKFISSNIRTQIPSYSFYNMHNLTICVLSRQITNLGERSFTGCWCLRSLLMPASLITLRGYIFASAHSYKTIVLPLNAVQVQAYTFYESAINTCILPYTLQTASWNNNSPSYLFARSRSLEYLALPNTVSNIPESFVESNYMLAKFCIPENVLTIGTQAFAYTPNLRKIQGGLNVHTTSVRSFGFSSVSNPNIFPNLEILGTSTFYATTLQYPFIAPSTLRSIGSTVFQSINNNATAISIIDLTAANPLVLTEACFYSIPALKEVYLPDNLIVIPARMCYDCPSLSYIKVPETVTTINRNAFYGCYNLDVNQCIPPNLLQIGDGAFYNCYSTYQLKFPASLQSLGSGCFSEMRNLKYIDFTDAMAVPTLIGISTLFPTCKIVVPDVLYDEWITATNWSALAAHIYKASEVEVENA